MNGPFRQNTTKFLFNVIHNNYNYIDCHYDRLLYNRCISVLICLNVNIKIIQTQEKRPQMMKCRNR